MINYVEGNLFDSSAQVLVNTVNTVGVMGKGIALEFKNRYPNNFELYKSQCDKHKLTIGRLLLCYEKDHWILNFPTKENWRNPSKLEYIEKGLETFVRKYNDYSISSIAFPKLGCGNGGLNWEDVRVLMERYLKNLPIEIMVYLNNQSQQYVETDNIRDMSEWLKNNSKDLSFVGIKDTIDMLCLNSNYSFHIESQNWDLFQRTDKTVFKSNQCEVILSENEMHQIWDDIQKNQLFSNRKI